MNYETRQVRVKDLKIGDIITQGAQYFKVWRVDEGQFIIQRHIWDDVRDIWYWQRATFNLRVNSNQFIMLITDYDL